MRSVDELPTPDGDAVQHLRHTVAAWEDVADDTVAIHATSGLYDQPTGLTWGDLREVLHRLDS
jgi:hypothetical protein